MYCKHCGKQIDEDATFCQHCGKQIRKTGDSKQKSQLNSDQTFQWARLTTTIEIPGPPLFGVKYRFVLKAVFPDGNENTAGPEFWAPAQVDIEADLAEQYAKEELHKLINVLIESGWEYEGRGAKWYHHNFRRPFTSNLRKAIREQQKSEIKEEAQAVHNDSRRGCSLFVLIIISVLVMLGVISISTGAFRAAPAASTPSPKPTDIADVLGLKTPEMKALYRSLIGIWQEQDGTRIYTFNPDGTIIVQNDNETQGEGIWVVNSNASFKYTINGTTEHYGVTISEGVLFLKKGPAVVRTFRKR